MTKIQQEITKRRIKASMKETPYCFGWCLTQGDVEELLKIQRDEILKEIDKLANKEKAVETNIGEYDKFVSVHNLKQNIIKMGEK